jgi:hypothetical protein
MVTAGRWGKRERATRRIDSPTHLGLWWCAEAERGGVGYGRRRWKAQEREGSGWEGAGCDEQRPLFIGRGKAVEQPAEHATLVRPATMAVRLCRRRDVNCSDKFMALLRGVTRWAVVSQVVAAASGDAERMVACDNAVGVEVMGRAGGVNARRGVEQQRLVLSWLGVRHPEVEGWRAVCQGEGQAGGAESSGRGVLGC